MKKCPFCKMEIPTGASICGHCRKQVSTAGLIGQGLQSLGCILTLLFTVPILLGVFFLKGC